jgi:hypothetical protein
VNVTDPVIISLASIGVVALNEGIKFLYGQAGDILKEWRQRRDQLKSNNKERATICLPSAFDGQLQDPSVDYDIVKELEPKLEVLRGELSSYATDLLPTESGNLQLLRRVDDLRQCLEAVLHQHITFKGEKRSLSGTVVVGHVEAEIIAGEAIGVEGQGQAEAEVRGSVSANKLEHGAKATGVKWNM